MYSIEFERQKLILFEKLNSLRYIPIAFHMHSQLHAIYMHNSLHSMPLSMSFNSKEIQKDKQSEAKR